MLSIFCFLLISFGVGSVSAQVCMEDKGNFIPNSTFDINRRSLISSLPSKVVAEDNFYYNGFIGEEPNRVYTVGMCSPESTLNDCYDCIKTASDQFLQNCPNQTEAYTWPGNPVCYARYSDISFVGSVDLTSRYLLIIAGKITSDLTEFRKLWEKFMRRMIDAVSTESSPSSTSNHYKADLAALTPIQNIYALMQCTPDLSSGQCELCLQRNAADFQSCCSDGLNTGGIVARPSCFLRWDLSPFSKVFDDIKMASPPPQPPVTVPQPAGHQPNTTRNC